MQQSRRNLLNFAKTALFVSACLVTIFGSIYWFIINDTPLARAKGMFPLGMGNPYILIKSDMGYTVKPYFFAIIKPGEHLDAANLSYRRIGESDVDLNLYTDKVVYIDGSYYEGLPLLDSNSTEIIPENALIVPQPVIRINKLILVK